MQYRALVLFSSALAVSLAIGCSSDDDAASGGAAAGKAGAAAGAAGKATGTEAGRANGGGAGDDTTPDSAGAAGADVSDAGAGGEAGSSALSFATLDGSMPLVIGHRGLPGLHPEETIVSYDGAVEAGADSLEEDLHLTKDCVLVARHNPWLSDNTNITAVAATNATVMARKRTVPGVAVNVTYDVATYGGPATYLSDRTDPADQKSVLKSLVVDGEEHVGDWSITDFTVAELKQWIGGTTFDVPDQRPTYENGKYPILTMQEIIDKAKAASKSTGRTITVYPESKNPYWNDQQAIANGCDTAGTEHPFEDAILKLIKDNDLNDKSAPIMVQSFDPASLKYLRSIGLKTKVVQLIDGNDVNYETGEMIYQTNDKYNFVDGRPYSWTLSGDPRYFGVMLTKEGLAEVKTYADGIGPWKPQVMSWKAAPFKAGATLTADVNSIEPTSLIADAHAAGLFVHSYTFRNEQKFLAAAYQGDPVAEYLQFFRAGIDGVFTDFANTGFAAREQYIAELKQGTR